MTITIRTLRADEAPLLKKLYVEMSDETPTAYGDRPDQIAEWSDEKWQEMATAFATLPAYVAYVAESQEVNQEGATSELRAAGFVAAFIISEGELNAILGQSPPDNPDALTQTTILTRMWVASHLRGQGQAHQLIARVLEWAKAKGQARVLLGVTDDNERASRSYARAGFAMTGLTLPHPGYAEHTINAMGYEL